MTKSARVSPLESHLGYWLRVVSNHVSHGFKSKVEAHGVTVAECEYGVRFPALVGRGLVQGTQFHPEKSQRWGLRLLANFAQRVAVAEGSRA